MCKTCLKNCSFSTHCLSLEFDPSVFWFMDLHCKSEEQIIRGCKTILRIFVIIIQIKMLIMAHLLVENSKEYCCTFLCGEHTSEMAQALCLP